MKYVACNVLKMWIRSFMLTSFFLSLACGNPRCTCDNTQSCQTTECVRAASTILSYIDQTVKPCDDFYQFVCGTFMKNAYVDETPSQWSKVRRKYTNQLKAIVVDPISKDDPQTLRSVKKFYRSCMDQETIKNESNVVFRKLVDELGGWPLAMGKKWNEFEFDWVDFFIKSHKLGLYGRSMVDFGKEENEKGNDTIILDILVEVANDKYSEDDRDVIYDKVKNMAKKLYGKEAVLNKRELHKFTDFLFDYKEIYDDINSKRRVITIRQLIKKIPKIPWLKLINEGLGFNLTEKHKVFLYIENTIKQVLDLIESSDKRTQANYLIWNIIQEFEPYLALKGDDDEEESLTERHELCLKKVDELFEYYKEIIFVRRMANPVVQDQVNEMIENIKNHFIVFMQGADWMDEETKKKGIEKANRMLKVIGASEDMYNETYFDRILGANNFSVNSTNVLEIVTARKRMLDEALVNNMYENTPDDEYSYFFEEVNDVNAFFLQNVNMMVIPAPILQDLFFNPEAPAFMNYGSLGAVIGHEVMHGFTKDARVFQLPNSTEIDWWTDQVERNFDKKVQCVVDQYETFKVDHTYKMDGDLTMEENVADFVGKDAAYQAYQSWVKKHGEEQSLPGLNFTTNQLYWIQAAAFECFKKIDSNEEDLNEPDAHGVPRFRIIASMRNSKYFAKDFDCPIGSPMNPQEKCQIF